MSVEWVTTRHVAKAQAYQGSRGGSPQYEHLQRLEAAGDFVSGRLTVPGGRTLCKKQHGWYEVPSRGEPRCPECSARAERHGIVWPGDLRIDDGARSVARSATPSNVLSEVRVFGARCAESGDPAHGYQDVRQAIFALARGGEIPAAEPLAAEVFPESRPAEQRPGGGDICGPVRRARNAVASLLSAAVKANETDIEKMAFFALETLDSILGGDYGTDTGSDPFPEHTDEDGQRVVYHREPGSVHRISVYGSPSLTTEAGEVAIGVDIPVDWPYGANDPEVSS